MQTPQSIMESEQYQLDRRSTALKKMGDMAGACAALRQRKSLMGVLYDDTKLAKYLQEAGHFEEAMEEIQWLLDTNQERISLTIRSPDVSTATRQATHARLCGSFHRAAALMCNRQGLPEKRRYHEATAEKYFAISERLNPIGQADSEVLRERRRIAIDASSALAIQKFRGNL